MKKKNIALWVAAGIATSAAAGIVYAQVVPEGQSRTQVQEQAGRAFDRMDVNLDGQIDAADREMHQRARFDAADADGNGNLGFTEFAALRPGLDGARPGPGMRGERHGDKSDRGGRGEHGGRHGMRGFGNGFGLLPVISDADANGNDAVTQAEFSKAILGRFDRADANKDGIMTREEASALRKAIRTEHQAAAGKPAPRPATGQES